MGRHSIYTALLVFLALVCVSCTETGVTSLGFELDIRSAPPPPRVVYVDEPDVVAVSGTRVYVVEDPSIDYDMFRYGSTWYIAYDGYWYRSSSYRGTYVVVDVRDVPHEVVTVPPERWRHHPPGRGHRHRHEGDGA